MGTLDAIDWFAITVAAGSFAAAARRLGVTASAVSRRIAGLERELGVTLLARTTRSLSLTHDGQSFHAHCLRIIEELHEAKAALARVRKRPSGVVRVDATVAFGRNVLAPRLPDFLARFPELRVELTLRDQFVDPFAEGLDVLVRIGPLRDTALIARRLGESKFLVCASPAYLRRHGTPRTPDELARHGGLGYLRDGRALEWHFGERIVDVDGRLHANDSETLLRGALAGLGLVFLPDFLVADAVKRGELVTLFESCETLTWPIHALYPKNRHLLPKVGVFLGFLGELLSGAPKRRRTRDERS